MQYYFYMRISQVTSSQFAKYFGDTYSEYITLCTVMTYDTSDAIWVTPPWLRSGPTEWIILRMAHKRKLANCLSHSERWINFHIIYYLLYMLIMQVYHDSDRMRDFGRMPNSGQKI
jgi:hypothetical protein